jgi:DNA-binding CsgD family transcriptional regulator
MIIKRSCLRRAGRPGRTEAHRTRDSPEKAVKHIASSHPPPTDSVAPQADVQRVNDSLSLRETDVLRCICDGLARKEMAYVLGITEKTVDFHLHRIREKTELRTIAHLVRYAIRTQLVDP